MASETLLLHLTSTILLWCTLIYRPNAPRLWLKALIALHVLRMVVDLVPVVTVLFINISHHIVAFPSFGNLIVVLLAMAILVSRGYALRPKITVRLPIRTFAGAILNALHTRLSFGFQVILSGFSALWSSPDGLTLSRLLPWPFRAVRRSIDKSNSVVSAVLELVPSLTFSTMGLTLVPLKGAVTSSLTTGESLVSIVSSAVGDLALVPFESSGTSTLVSTGSLASLASYVTEELALVPYKGAVGSTLAATKSLASAAFDVVHNLALVPFKGAVNSTIVGADSLTFVPSGAVEEVSEFWEAELLEIWSLITTAWFQDGLWLVVQHMYVPHWPWDIGDMPVIGTRAETNIMRLNAVDIGYDSQGFFCMLCEIVNYPGNFQTVPLSSLSIVVNKAALPEQWFMWFAGLFWSARGVSVPNVVKTSDPRLALVTIGHRPATVQFLDRLHRYVSQRLEQMRLKTRLQVAIEDAESAMVKLPFRTKFRPALALAMSKVMDTFASDVGLVISTAEVPFGTSSDAPLANVIVKLPRANATEAQGQQRKGRRGCPGPRGKRESTVNMTPAVGDGKLLCFIFLDAVDDMDYPDKENVPVSAASSAKKDAKQTRGSPQITEGGMRLLNRTVASALFHNRRRR
ncbi:uncharacterized protein B0H18DRAFT_1122027 [Fomitopsis serialis]|uniref:uncharacterized protein n=1 Tax=Fomitopsis serialis TaxID=139415 RepID=UPI002007DC2D|nr:uncharacterized protein B0H18DRAFT_1122027 [Neoantrodia serialis]KAH9920299.1 hypothetical protein B0H18DRAFT_1122027 [Neoantrodia serialis]